MENKIKGGKSDGMTIEDIAKKHKIDVDLLKVQLENGIEVEKEHTKNKETAKEIAMDHLFEFPDYYTRLKKMEKSAEKDKNPVEAKECTGADASGSFEGPLSKTILKRDIYKLHNFKPKEQEVKEVTGSSSSGQYDAPIGHGAKTQADALKIDNAESTSKGSASITAAPTKNMTAMKKGFPKYGGPEGKWVEIDKRCKTFPYCNQGDDNQIKLTEAFIKEAVQEASKKYGLPTKEIEKIVYKEIISEGIPQGIFDDPGNLSALRGWTDKGPKPEYKVTTKDPIDITLDDDVELAKLKLIFYKHDVDFNVDEIKK